MHYNSLNQVQSTIKVLKNYQCEWVTLTCFRHKPAGDDHQFTHNNNKKIMQEVSGLFLHILIQSNSSINGKYTLLFK